MCMCACLSECAYTFDFTCVHLHIHACKRIGELSVQEFWCLGSQFHDVFSVKVTASLFQFISFLSVLYNILM